MNSTIHRVFISLVILISLGGGTLADEQPVYVMYIQGGENSITSEADGAVSLTIRDIIPYANIIHGERNTLIPVEISVVNRLPAPAAVVLNEGRNESVTFVAISDLSLSEGNTTLTILASPEKFYEGEALRSFDSGTVDIRNLIERKFDHIGVYLEEQEQPVENKWNNPNAPVGTCMNDCMNTGKKAYECANICNI